MKCEEVRDQLAEHLLATLEDPVDAAVRKHLRGCGSCRAEMTALGEGVSTLAAAAHDVAPPDELHDRVLRVLEEEWAEVPVPVSIWRRSAWLARAAAAVVLAVALGWGTFETIRASRFEEAAGRYETFLGVLGGEDVRVGELRPARSQELQGSVVMYDSKVGQSWVIVLCRAPGWTGEAQVTLVDNVERTIDLRPMEFGEAGEASTWLVTASDLRRYDRVNVWDADGLIASARVDSA